MTFQYKSSILHMKDYIKNFSSKTTLHGFQHLISESHHPAEIIFWLLLITVCIVAACVTISINYERFRSDPTMVTIEENFRDWNVTFPAMTFCLMDRMNNTRAEELIRELWGDVTSDSMDYYKRYIKAISNISYRNLQYFDEFKNDSYLANLGSMMEDIAIKVHPELAYWLHTYNSHVLLHPTQVVTELGLCFSIGSVVAHFLSPRYNSTQSVPEGMGVSQNCSVLLMNCGGNLQLYNTPAKFTIHSPYETVESNTKFHSGYPFKYVDVKYTLQDFISEPELRTLQPSQRHCFYPDEVQIPGIGFHSYNLCLMRCRMGLALLYCDCVPYFYSLIKNANDKVCDARGLACLSTYWRMLETRGLQGDHSDECSCLHPCDLTVYIPVRLEHNPSGRMEDVVMSWNALSYPVRRYKRSVIYGYGDLLVSYGGTAAFFLGCSLLSAIEFLYFFTLRALCSLVTKQKKVHAVAKRRRREIRIIDISG